MFIPTSTGYSAAKMDVTSLPMHIEQVLSCIVWDRVTAYHIQQRAYSEAEEVGPNVTNNRKKHNSRDVCEVHKSWENKCFLAVISKHEVSKYTTCPVLDGTLRSRRGGANVMNSYEK